MAQAHEFGPKRQHLDAFPIGATVSLRVRHGLNGLAHDSRIRVDQPGNTAHILASIQQFDVLPEFHSVMENVTRVAVPRLQTTARLQAKSGRVGRVITRPTDAGPPAEA